MLYCGVVFISVGWSAYAFNLATYQFWWLNVISVVMALIGAFILMFAQDRIDANIEETKKLHGKVSSLESQVSFLKYKLDKIENDQIKILPGFLEAHIK